MSATDSIAKAKALLDDARSLLIQESRPYRPAERIAWAHAAGSVAAAYVTLAAAPLSENMPAAALKRWAIEEDSHVA